jgi:hypothetical protein
LRRAGRRRVAWSLRRRLTLLVVVVAVLPLAGLGVLSYVVTVRRETASALRQLDSVAAVQEARVEAVLYQNFQVDLPLIQNDWRLGDLLAKAGVSGTPADRAALARHLHVLVAAAPVIHNIIAILPDGTVAASSGLGGTGSLAIFPGVMTGLEANVLGPLVLDTYGHVVHLMAGPVFRDGIKVGALLLETTTSDFDALVSDYSGLGRTGETILAMKDPQGDALFIAPLRFDPNAAFTREIAKTERSRAIVQALDGFEGIIGGCGYLPLPGMCRRRAGGSW